MKTWVLWTHYDCEVYVTLHGSEMEAYEDLKSNWLDDCSEDDCGHDPENMDAGDISSALEYHLDDLEYGISEVDVPVPTTSEQLTAERVERPTEENSMPAEIADDLLSRLQSFQGST